jgi:hypothetical protein
MKQYLWKENNTFGDPPLLYAAGASIAAWNLCEIAMLGLLQQFIKSHNAISSKVYALLGNNSRSELLEFCSSQSEKSIKELTYAFIKHYTICLQNRNTIAHAMYLREKPGGGHVLKKFPKFSVEKINTFDVDDRQCLKSPMGAMKPTYLECGLQTVLPSIQILLLAASCCIIRSYHCQKYLHNQNA